MNEYVRRIVERVEPEILNSMDEIVKACPSADIVSRRGYRHQILFNSLEEIEEVNKMYRECERLRAQGKEHEVDHIVPLFQGGNHSLHNLQILDKRSHKVKNRKERRGYRAADSTRRP